MGVAEGRQLAFDEARRLEALPWNDVLSLPEDDQTTRVFAPSGREYTLKIGFDHSESGDEYEPPASHGSVRVRPTGLFRWISYYEGVYAEKESDQDSASSAINTDRSPTAFPGEIWRRARWMFFTPLIVIGIAIVIPVALIVRIRDWVKGDDAG